MDDQGPERRTQQRTGLVLKVEYPSVEGFLQDYTANISRGGTMICTRREVAKGQGLELIVSFPGLLKPIRLRGVVRWTQQEADGQRSFGVEFDQQPEAGWPVLQQLVSRIVARDESIVAARLLRVLVVEDNRHLADMIRRGLETHLWRHGEGVAFHVRHAADGVDALAQLEEEPVELVLVDVFMPIMDGETLVRKLRADQRWAALPIIAFSAGDDNVREMMHDAGADYFLAKPIRLADLLSTMLSLARACQANAAPNGDDAA